MPGRLPGLGRAALDWVSGWWQVLFIGAELTVLALSPSSYRRESRRAVLRQLYRAGGPGLPGFTIMMALFNVVVIRIFVVTAYEYGLSSYALEAIVRVLVLELVPLLAALYVAINYTVPGGSEVHEMQRRMVRTGSAQRFDLLGREVLPRVLGGSFAVLLLALISCVISLILAYVAIYGFTTFGLPAYNRAVGRIFDPGVTLIFSLKTALFAGAVALLPVANALRYARSRLPRMRVELRGLMQMLVLLLVIEIASLLGNY